MKFMEIIKEVDDFWYDFLNDIGIVGPNARVTSDGIKIKDNYRKAEREIVSKVYLIDSSLVKWPVDHLAKYSLRNLETEIDKKGDEEKIKGMLRKHEQLIQILKPYENTLPIDQRNPIYSEDYNKKYHGLRYEFLKRA